ncbi:MAG: ABC transporter permease [Deinococcaceae bacterium]
MNILRKTLRKPLGMVGAGLILAFFLIAVFAPFIAPIPEDIRAYGSTFSIPNRMSQVGFSPIPIVPSAAHPFGISQDGYDIFFGLVWGSRGAFIIGITVTGLSLLVGLIVGTLSGYFGGWLDNVLMRVTDVVFAFPSLVLLIVLVTVLERNLTTIMIAIAVTGWGQYARVLRGEILKVKRLEYVDAARAIGAFDFRIMFKHVLPNSLTTLLVLVSLDIGTTVVAFAALSFLGIGAPSGFPDWGQLITLSKSWLTYSEYWFTWLYPGLCIIVFVLAWNMLGDALRDATDPRSK